MIIIIICIALVVLSIPVYYAVERWASTDDALFLPCGLFLVGLLCGIISGVWCAWVNFPTYVANEQYKITEQYKLCENEKTVLLSFHTLNEGTTTQLTSDITLETISTNDYYVRVNEYNEKIYKFKINVMNHKNYRANPWTNWFESAAWDAITLEMLDNLSYTTGK